MAGATSTCKLCGKSLGDPHWPWCPLYDDTFGRYASSRARTDG